MYTRSPFSRPKPSKSLMTQRNPLASHLLLLRGVTGSRPSPQLSIHIYHLHIHIYIYIHIYSITPGGLLSALERFGLPNHIVEIIHAIYSTRKLYVNECGVDSDVHSQESGISQGCPLSPYLFVILMTIVLDDAREHLRQTYGVTLPEDAVNELLYADDTLLVAAHGPTVEKYLQCIVDIGRENGLLMNWRKVELLTSNCAGGITQPDRTLVQPKPSFIYLGSLIAADGNVSSELARRLGAAQAEFKRLNQVWRHSRLSVHERIKVYMACVVSLLLYGLQAMWPNKVARSKLDAFHARSLRAILGVKPSYYSRVSNQEVLRRGGCASLSQLLLEQQLNFFGKLARWPPSCPVRQLVFDDGLAQRLVQYQRRRGRPKLEWANEIFKVVKAMFPSQELFVESVLCETSWRDCIRKHCRRQA